MIGANNRRNRRHGFTLTELLVSATLLIGMMLMVGQLTVRTGRLWQECRGYRLALDELTNQLDQLAALSAEERDIALTRLAPSESICAALPNPKFISEVRADQDGTRLHLQLAWDRLDGEKQIGLVRWIDPLAAIGEQASTLTDDGQNEESQAREEPS